MSKFRITPKAKVDLQNIGRYTENRWGKKQRNKYLIDLEKRFILLAKNPRIGKHRVDIRNSYYSFPQGEHVVFYIINQDSIDIIGIPHKEMDIISYFQPN